ncbi:hypothetical protein PVK06_022810 [Gossypium arboreum]|uniref:RNase H type-1 domain-containing protein n=1 Tax=Gossypium arboreum TaxID=29729 RepID=A0ABR0P9D5_GOSAR|nr:hypothetical protein PVK06_022810 [Gossypium arboreum]
MWVPSLPEKRIPVLEINTLVRLVSNLINPQTRRWIEQKLTTHLTDEVAKRVRYIPLARNLLDDMVVWGDELSGEFTVQSAYNIFLHEDISPEVLGFREVILESNALSMIKKMRSCINDGSDIGAYIYDAKIKVEMFSRCSYRHVSRYANTVAHIVAKEGLRRGGSAYLVGNVPDFVRAMVEMDRHGRHGGVGRRNGECST